MSAAHELFVDDREEDLLDGDVDPGAESAWAIEIERRARRAIAGESEGLDCDAVLSRIERRLSGA